MEQRNHQPTQEKIESKPPIKTNWKYLAIVMAFALLAVGGILLLKTMEPASSPAPVFQQTPPPASPSSGGPAPSPQPQTPNTSEWQTYRNEEFGFEVKYPSDWILSSLESIPPEDIYGWSSIMISNPNKESEIVIETGTPYEHTAPGGITGSLTPQERIASMRAGVIDTDTSGKEEKITIGGTSAVKFIYTISDPITHEQNIFIQAVLIPLDHTKILEISQSSEYSKKEYYEKFFNQILSTFRFVP